MSTARGVVREWYSSEGWGVIDSDATPGGCWAPFSALRMAAPRAAESRQLVTFEFENGPVDGYDFRATRVEIDGVEVVEPEVNTEPSSAYGSQLFVRGTPVPPPFEE